MAIREREKERDGGRRQQPKLQSLTRTTIIKQLQDVFICPDTCQSYHQAVKKYQGTHVVSCPVSTSANISARPETPRGRSSGLTRSTKHGQNCYHDVLSFKIRRDLTFARFDCVEIKDSDLTRARTGRFNPTKKERFFPYRSLLSFPLVLVLSFSLSSPFAARGFSLSISHLLSFCFRFETDPKKKAKQDLPSKEK